MNHIFPATLLLLLLIAVAGMLVPRHVPLPVPRLVPKIGEILVCIINEPAVWGLIRLVEELL